MNTLLDQMIRRQNAAGYDLPAVAARYGLTTRETQLLEMLTRFREKL